MTHFLLGTASVHTTAAACDYLSTRIEPEDSVTALAVTGEGLTERDAGDALNVVEIRLPTAEVETIHQDGDPAATILAVATELGVDELVLGRRRGDPAATEEGLGSTAGSVAAEADRPVVILPPASPSP